MSEIVFNLPIFFIHVIVLLGGKRSRELFTMLRLDFCGLWSHVIYHLAERKRNIPKLFILSLTLTFTFLDHTSFNDFKITTRFSWTEGIIKHIEYTSFTFTAFSFNVNLELMVPPVHRSLPRYCLWIYNAWDQWRHSCTCIFIISICYTFIWTLFHRQKSTLW